MAELSGTTAVVTGGASGIGKAIAERFVAEGMNVVLADIERAPLELTAKELGGEPQVVAVPTDVTDVASVEALRDTTLERFGSVHVICNNAGVGGLGNTTWDGPLAAWEWVMGVNFWGVLHGIRAFVPVLIEQDAGHVVNTSSLAGLHGMPGFGPYAAAKHAVLAMSEGLQTELTLQGSNVRVHVMCPGFLKTGIAGSERNWPARLGEMPPASDDEGAQVRQLINDLVDGGLPPSALADELVDALNENRFFVTTHPAQAQHLTAARAATIRGEDVTFPDIS